MWPTYETGSTIVVTESWRDLLWSASPHLVVESTPESLITFQPAGSISVRSSNKGMAYSNDLTRSERKLAALESCLVTPMSISETPTKLYFYTPESWTRINLGWDAIDGHFMGWYVNFERPARRTEHGLVSKDLILDLYIHPDLSWEWKDEQEFAQAIDRQIIEPELQEIFQTEGVRVLAQAAAGEGAFEARWQTFISSDDRVPKLPERFSENGPAWKLPFG